MKNSFVPMLYDVFPPKGITEKIWGNEPKFKIGGADIVDAVVIQNNEVKDSIPDFVYVKIKTKVGVTTLRKGKMEYLNIGLKFDSTYVESPPTIQVKEVFPKDANEVESHVQYEKIVQSDAGFTTKGKANASIPVIAEIGVKGRFSINRDSFRNETSEYEKYVAKTLGNGQGTSANWQFDFNERFPKQSQFNLETVLEIRRKIGEFEKFAKNYFLKPEFAINGEPIDRDEYQKEVKIKIPIIIHR